MFVIGKKLCNDCVWDFCLVQPLLVARSREEPLSTTIKVVTALMLQYAKRIQKLHVFGPFRKSQLVNYVQITSNSQQENFESIIQTICIVKHCFYSVFFAIFSNHIVSVWYCDLPFLSNVETQVSVQWAGIVQ